MESQQITVQLHFSKSTKRTHVYATADETAAITQLYIKQSAFVGAVPKMIEVVVTAPVQGV